MPVILILAFALATTAPGPAAASDGRDGRFITCDAYASDGAFVEWPAQAFGLTTLVLVGSTATIVCMPYDLLAAGAGRSDFGSFAGFCGTVVGGPAGNGAYAVAGVPFWVIKQLTWDGPRRLFAATPAHSDAP